MTKDGEIPAFTPEPTPVEPKIAPVLKSAGHERIELGLSFWKPLLYVVGGSIIMLVLVLAAVECYGTYAMNQLYVQALKLASSNGGKLDSDDMRALLSLTSDARESQQAFRAAWQQAAQLILVNLLLPVLTALLGYIFGVQQGRASEAAERER